MSYLPSESLSITVNVCEHSILATAQTVSVGPKEYEWAHVQEERQKADVRQVSHHTGQTLYVQQTSRQPVERNFKQEERERQQ